jgi:amidase
VNRPGGTAPLADAHDLVAAMRDGELTPAMAVEEAIARIQAADGVLNAVIHRRFDRARREVSQVKPGQPFGGTPLLIKDALCATRGDPYHLGMRVLRDAGWRSAQDSHLAQRFRRAGFVLLGRTNTPELAGSYTTEPLAYGPTRNPWDHSRSPGGSSGGSAAAVAAGFVPVAHGNDTGGSIRVPASMCGVVGIKPSRAAISLGPEFGEFRGFLTCEGILTRSVRDAAAVLPHLTGGAPGDPYPPPASARRPAAGRPAERRLRVGVSTAPPGGRERVHPACAAAADKVASALGRLGHQVTATEIPALAEAAYEGDLHTLVAVGILRDLDRWSARLGREISQPDVEPWTWEFASKGRSVSGSGYVSSVESLQAACRDINTWWRAHLDILVTPAVPVPAPRLGFVARAECDAGVFARPFNVSGQPAISIPAGYSEDGLPVGVQLVAATGQDELLLRVAGQAESVIGRARPPGAVCAATAT